MIISLIKNTLKYVTVLVAILCCFLSCQDEITQISSPNDQETITQNSNLANLLQNTATLDGSIDNILDNANCILINLPVTITVNGVEVIVENETDFEVIETLFNEFTTDDDTIEFLFPIVITLNNYEDIEIANETELEAFIADCAGENENDDDIECIDFQYPITFSIYNADFQITETVEIENDAALYNFIDNLENGVLASLNFPVTMVLSNGNTVEVNSNQELEIIINEAEDDCDEDDDYDWEDDENETPFNCFQDLEIVECDTTGFGEYNLESIYQDCLNDNVIVTYHETIVDAQTAVNPLTVVYFNATLNNTYYARVELLEDGTFQTYQINLLVESCVSSCTEVDVDNYLVACIWNVVNYNGSDNLIVYNLDFNSNGTLLITGNGQTITSTWSTSETNDGVWVAFNSVNGPNIQAISGNWLITECEPDRLEMNQENNTMVIEQNCIDNGMCTEQDVDAILNDCEWTITNYAGDSSFSIFNISFNANQEMIIESTNENYTGQWTTSQTGSGEVIVNLSNITGGNVQIIEGEYVVVECTANQMIFHDVSNNGNELVLEKDCN